MKINDLEEITAMTIRVANVACLSTKTILDQLDPGDLMFLVFLGKKADERLSADDATTEGV